MVSTGKTTGFVEIVSSTTVGAIHATAGGTSTGNTVVKYLKGGFVVCKAQMLCSRHRCCYCCCCCCCCFVVVVVVVAIASSCNNIGFLCTCSFCGRGGDIVGRHVCVGPRTRHSCGVSVLLNVQQSPSTSCATTTGIVDRQRGLAGKTTKKLKNVIADYMLDNFVRTSAGFVRRSSLLCFARLQTICLFPTVMMLWWWRWHTSCPFICPPQVTHGGRDHMMTCFPALGTAPRPTAWALATAIPAT